MDLLLHPDSRHQLDHVVQDMPQAILIIAPDGAGKSTLVRYLTSQLLKVDQNKLSNYPYYHEVGDGEKSITIEDVRTLQSQSRLKTPGQAAVRRVFSLLGADNMTLEAQNALLKLLEAPPTDTILLLTATYPNNLLPTIRSRTQVIPIKPPTLSQASMYFTSQGFAESDIRKAYLLSEGSMGLLSALLHHQSDHHLSKAIEETKSLLKLPVYERLVRLEKISKNQEIEPIVLLDALGRVCRALLQESAKRGDRESTARFRKILANISNSEIYLAANVSSKLVMTELALHI